MSNTSHISPFEVIRRVSDNGIEYWSARDLYKLLGYSSWQKFQFALDQAKKACENSGQAVSEHFNLQVKMVQLGFGGQRKTEDHHLSRYACYLIIQNADSSKPIVALGQTYFAVQTRRQELADGLAALPENQKRLILRSEMAIFNAQLAETAQQAGVIEPRDFAIFQDHGYMGLYGGLKENDIHTRKGLTSEKQKILDYMGSEELGANIFRVTQTDAKLGREQVKGKDKANHTQSRVVREVPKTIKRLGGTMPEVLPTPKDSIQELQRKEQKRLAHRSQPPLLANRPPP